MATTVAMAAGRHSHVVRLLQSAFEQVYEGVGKAGLMLRKWFDDQNANRYSTRTTSSYQWASVIGNP
jgi:hypothetical protein